MTKTPFFSLTLLSALLNIVFALLTYFTKSPVMLSLTVTTGTMFYHFIMRTFVGAFTPHSFKYTQKWFKEKPFERDFYKLIKVKKWKKFMPTCNPQSLRADKNSLEDIANTMCRNEIIHETIMVLSFVPLLFTLYADSFTVFLITSVFACMFDALFVIMQRFNRPRIVKLISRIKNK